MSNMTRYEGFSGLSVRLDGGVARIIFNHGPMNLLDAVLVPDLIRLAGLLESDDEVGVVVFVSANPDYFLSHADLRLLQHLRDVGAYESREMPVYSALLERFRTMPKVCIAQVEGRSRGGGAEFVLAMDMSFAAIGRASLSQMEVALGMLPGGGAAQYLARKLGRSRAMEICLGGGDFSAEEAERYGYINRALPADEIDGFVDELARRIASYPRKAVALNKATVNLFEDGRANELITSNAWFADLVKTPEFDKRVAKFLERGGQTAVGEQKNFRDWAKELV
jgi:enoyl-CoA hydratase/carnithine racemase